MAARWYLVADVGFCMSGLFVVSIRNGKRARSGQEGFLIAFDVNVDVEPTLEEELVTLLRKK